MKPNTFEYRQPETLAEALALLAEHGDEAKVIAGGQSLVPMMNMRLVSPTLLIDISRIDQLKGIKSQDNGLQIGSLTLHREIAESPLVEKRARALYLATEFVAHLAVRNRGTIGGSLCHADPSAEFPACALLLDAVLEIRSKDDARSVPAAEFFDGPFTTAVGPEEILTRVDILADHSGKTFVFDEISRRQGDFAMAGIAASCELRDGVLERRCIGFGCADRPIRLLHVEALLSGCNAEPCQHDLKRAIEDDIDQHLEGSTKQFRSILMTALIQRHMDQLMPSMASSS